MQQLIRRAEIERMSYRNEKQWFNTESEVLKQWLAWHNYERTMRDLQVERTNHLEDGYRPSIKGFDPNSLRIHDVQDNLTGAAPIEMPYKSKFP